MELAAIEEQILADGLSAKENKMKISVDDVELFTLSATQVKVIKNDIRAEIFEDDMKRRLKWVLFEEKYIRCLQRLKEQWEPVLKARSLAIPDDVDAFAELVFIQPDYKDRSAREAAISV